MFIMALKKGRHRNDILTCWYHFR